jgi:Protoglobin
MAVCGSTKKCVLEPGVARRYLERFANHRMEGVIVNIPGYTYGQVRQSPVSLAEFETMKHSALFGDEDLRCLRMSHDVLKDQVEAVLDVWYGFVGSQPQLLASFSSKTGGVPLGDYLAAVRKRFGQWILDTSSARYDQDWLNYQHEIGLRHHRTRKNLTDGVDSTPIVPFRDLFALVFPVTFTLKPFLAKKGHSAQEVDAMYQAWLKSCLLQLTLWSHPYVKEGDF